MRDRRRLRGIRKGSDLVETFLIAHGDALVLAEMLFPRGHHVLLDNAARIGRVLPHAP